jgi:hypothetical protein
MTRLGIALTIGVLGSMTLADDAKPAPFPDKAYAVLVQGSDDHVAFKKDINNMETVLTHANNRWQYGAGSIRKLLTGGAGDNKTTWANVGKALDAAGKALWAKPPGDQNFVYYHSSHGGKGDNNKNSTLSFGDGYKSAKKFASEVKDKMPDGGQIHSLGGTFETTCVRTMAFMLQGCNTGGFIWELTHTLTDKTLRRKHFPMLSDITVMTAADWNETAYNMTGGLSTFSRELYGYDSGGHQTGALEGPNARSAWDVYKYAAQKDVSNNNQDGYHINAKWGTGNNATMYVKGTRPDGSGDYEHPLYRHVRFMPAHTLGDPADGTDGRVATPIGYNNLDFTLDGNAAPISGFVPIAINFTALTGGGLYVDRDISPDESLGNPTEGWFLDYYSFDLIPTDGLTFETIYAFNLAIESDDIVKDWIDLDDVKLFNYRDSAWADTGATFNQSTFSFSLNDYDALGTFAVVVPTPAGAIAIALFGMLAVARRRGA